MTDSALLGLHHITAISSDAKKNLAFYQGILGLRLVKKTVNFDAPEVYHLYYGNEQGSPGTIMTFFAYTGLIKGRKGNGQLIATSFSVSQTSLSFWIERLKSFKIDFEGPKTRFDGEQYLYFEDGDGLGLELIFNAQDKRAGYRSQEIPLEHAIKGFYGVTISEEGYEKTANLLTSQMGYQKIAEDGNRFRYSITGAPGEFVDLLCNPDALHGLSGAGVIHHVAFATKNDGTQIKVRESLLKNGYNVTPVLDRQYFHSVYFREPGGVLFEVATNPPGFMVDEELAHLGEALKLPPWLEKDRKYIEEQLPSL